jgi:hypothetical protein
VAGGVKGGVTGTTPMGTVDFIGVPGVDTVGVTPTVGVGLELNIFDSDSTTLGVVELKLNVTGAWLVVVTTGVGVVVFVGAATGATTGDTGALEVVAGATAATAGAGIEGPPGAPLLTGAGDAVAVGDAYIETNNKRRDENLRQQNQKKVFTCALRKA